MKKVVWIIVLVLLVGGLFAAEKVSGLEKTISAMKKDFSQKHRSEYLEKFGLFNYLQNELTVNIYGGFDTDMVDELKSSPTGLMAFYLLYKEDILALLEKYEVSALFKAELEKALSYCYSDGIDFSLKSSCRVLRAYEDMALASPGDKEAKERFKNAKNSFLRSYTEYQYYSWCYVNYLEQGTVSAFRIVLKDLIRSL